MYTAELINDCCSLQLAVYSDILTCEVRRISLLRMQTLKYNGGQNCTKMQLHINLRTVNILLCQFS